MKKCIVTILFLMAFLSQLSAPPNEVVYLPTGEKINRYDPLIMAVVAQESSCRQTAYNKEEIACSYFQVRPVRLHDYNRRTGKHYTLADMYHYKRAEEVFMFYTKGRSYEAVARGWAGGDAGTKKATNDYWKRVQKHLN